MEEARRVLERLSRIEQLRAANAGPGALLAELQALLTEGEEWLATEHAAVAGDALAAEGVSDGVDADRPARSLAGLGAALARRVIEVDRSEIASPQGARTAAEHAGRWSPG